MAGDDGGVDGVAAEEYNHAMNTPTIAVGTKYQTAADKTWEVRAIVDTDYAVVRRPNRNWADEWFYDVEMIAVLEELLRSGTYKLVDVAYATKRPGG